MKITRSLLGANTLILSGMLMAATIVGGPLSLSDGRGLGLPYSAELVFAALAVTLAGTAWSGWLGLPESRPHGFWSRALFEFGFLVCVVESFLLLWGVLGIGAA
jgi:hypothetical protein